MHRKNDPKPIESTTAPVDAHNEDANPQAGGEFSASAKPSRHKKAASAVLATAPEEPQVTVVDPSASFRSICAGVREAVDSLEASMALQSLAIADRLAEAKKAYEAETGTGHGKGKTSRVTSFVEAAALELGRSASFVQRFLTLAKLSPERRALIAARYKDASMATLLAIARECDAERCVEQVAVRARDPLGERAKTDPSFAAVLKAVTDPKETLGGLTPETQLPPDLTQKFPELGAFANVGDLREAIARPAERAPAVRRDAEVTHSLVRLKHPMREAETVMVDGRRVAVRIAKLQVPRPALEQALAASNAARESGSLDAKAECDTPTVPEAVVTLLIGR